MGTRRVTIDGREQIDPRSTWAWRRLRAQVIAEEPTCRLRFPRICTVVSTTADHIITVTDQPELALVRTNLRGACGPCNDARRTVPDEALNLDASSTATPTRCPSSDAEKIWPGRISAESKHSARLPPSYAMTRQEAAVRLVLSSIEADHDTAARILNAEINGRDQSELKLFVAEVANVAEAFAVQWATGSQPAAPVAEVLRAWLDGTAVGVFAAAASVTRPPPARKRR